MKGLRMSITELKDHVAIVGIFGGGSGSLPKEAEKLGRIIAATTNWITLTGGSGPDPSSDAVKHRALVGPDDLDRPWIGVLQSKDDLPNPRWENGFVFK